MGVNLGGSGALVTQEILDDPEVGASLQKVGGKAVTEGVGRDASLDIRRFGGLLDDPLNGTGGQMAIPTVTAGKQPLSCGIGVAIDLDGFNGSSGQEGVPILAAFPLPDPEEVPVGFQILRPEADEFTHPQSSGVQKVENGPFLVVSSFSKEPGDFVLAQDGGQVVALLGSGELHGHPRLPED
jgi:hypothetical protein